nr:MAG TPA: hypothetical protein [Caudoviricetes sp.]
MAKSFKVVDVDSSLAKDEAIVAALNALGIANYTFTLVKSADSKYSGFNIAHRLDDETVVKEGFIPLITPSSGSGVAFTSSKSIFAYINGTDFVVGGLIVGSGSWSSAAHLAFGVFRRSENVVQYLACGKQSNPIPYVIDAARDDGYTSPTTEYECQMGYYFNGIYCGLDGSKHSNAICEREPANLFDTSVATFAPYMLACGAYFHGIYTSNQLNFSPAAAFERVQANGKQYVRIGASLFGELD